MPKSKLKKFRVKSKVQWKWLGRSITGVVKEVFTDSVTKMIKGKKITRHGSSEVPAYLVESEAGNLALKLQSELSEPTSAAKSKSKAQSKTKRSQPTLFRGTAST